MTPINWAADNGHIEIIRLLLAANADAQIPNEVSAYVRNLVSGFSIIVTTSTYRMD